MIVLGDSYDHTDACKGVQSDSEKLDFPKKDPNVILLLTQNISPEFCEYGGNESYTCGES